VLVDAEDNNVGLVRAAVDEPVPAAAAAAAAALVFAIAAAAAAELAVALKSKTISSLDRSSDMGTTSATAITLNSCSPLME
jgi:hypothetical protein